MDRLAEKIIKFTKEGRVNIEDNESMYYLQKCLKNMGIEDKLKELGICEGDTVKISDWELEWYE